MHDVVADSKVYVTRTPGVCGGRPCIAGHRITIELIGIHAQHGDSADDIVSTYHTLTLVEAHAALAYYYDNKQQIDQDIIYSDKLVDELRRQPGSGPLEASEIVVREDRAKVSC